MIREINRRNDHAALPSGVQGERSALPADVEEIMGEAKRVREAIARREAELVVSPERDPDASADPIREGAVYRANAGALPGTRGLYPDLLVASLRWPSWEY